MPEGLKNVVSFLDETLSVSRFRDYGPNGLQVEGAREVSRVVTGVSANAALIQAAVEAEAQIVVVHHGLVWGGGLTKISGPAKERLKLLLSNDISLAAYHLPLDRHEALGNNVGLARALSLTGDHEWFGPVKGEPMALAISLDKPASRESLIKSIRDNVSGGRLPFSFEFGPKEVTKVGLCTGAASDQLEAAHQQGCELFITGELAERASEVARELGLTLVAAGHYATEVFGPQSLASALNKKFSSLEATFVDVACPL